MDWTGNRNSVFKTLGASNHTDKERAHLDYYATDPIAIDKLCDKVVLRHDVWECACGEGHLSERLKERGYAVRSSDIVDRGYPGTEIYDFLNIGTILDGGDVWHGDIVTNPPYKYAQEFVERALSVCEDGAHIAMFLKLTFLEGKARRKLFDVSPPKTVLVFSERVLCAKNGWFEQMIAGGGSAVAYAWFVWEKGYNGRTTVEWI